MVPVPEDEVSDKQAGDWRGMDNLPGISVELYEVLLPGGMLNDR